MITIRTCPEPTLKNVGTRHLAPGVMISQGDLTSTKPRLSCYAMKKQDCLQAAESLASYVGLGGTRTFIGV